MRVDYDKDQLAYALANALKERDEARAEIQRLRLDAQREAEHHDRMVRELEKVYKERDDARKELEEYRSIAENIGATKAVSEKEKAIRERDEARLEAAMWALQRDEAREAAAKWEAVALREANGARGAIKSIIAWIKERRNAQDFTTMGMVEERLLKALEVRDDLAEETK